MLQMLPFTTVYYTVSVQYKTHSSNNNKWVLISVQILTKSSSSGSQQANAKILNTKIGQANNSPTTLELTPECQPVQDTWQHLSWAGKYLDFMSQLGLGVACCLSSNHLITFTLQKHFVYSYTHQNLSALQKYTMIRLMCAKHTLTCCVFSGTT